MRYTIIIFALFVLCGESCKDSKTSSLTTPASVPVSPIDGSSLGYMPHTIPNGVVAYYAGGAGTGTTQFAFKDKNSELFDVQSSRVIWKAFFFDSVGWPLYAECLDGKDWRTRKLKDKGDVVHWADPQQNLLDRVIKTYPHEPRVTTEWIADKKRVDSINFDKTLMGHVWRMPENGFGMYCMYDSSVVIYANHTENGSGSSFPIATLHKNSSKWDVNGPSDWDRFLSVALPSLLK